MSDERLRALDVVGRELERAIRADAARRRRPLRRWGGLIGVLAIVLGGGIALAAGLVRTGAPISGPSAADVGPDARPIAGSETLAGVPTGDPGGGPPWDLRVARTATGNLCVVVGQRYRDRFGIVGLDHVFRAWPATAADACGHPPSGANVLAQARTAVGSGRAATLTVVAGVAGPDVRGVRLSTRGGATRTLRFGRERAFVAVVRGLPEVVRPALSVTDARGTTRTEHFADPGGHLVADTDPHATPWRVEVSGAPQLVTRAGLAFLKAHPTFRGRLEGRDVTHPRERCAQVTRVAPSQLLALSASPPQTTGAACALPGVAPIALEVQRFVPSVATWGLRPARTIAWGIASPAVRTLTLRVQRRSPMALSIGRDGGFAAIVDGRVDPRTMAVVARLRDGRTIVRRGSVATRTVRGAPGPRARSAPAYRSVAQARRDVRGFAVPIRSTVRLAPEQRDPAGGPPWALRTYEATLAPHVRFGGKGPHPRRFSCFAVGQLVDGTLRRPTAGRPGPALGYGEGDTSCNDARAQPQVPAMLTAYSANATAYAPTIDRYIVVGLAPTARSAMLLGARGGARPLPLAGDGGFLAVLGPDDVPGPLRVRVRLASGRVQTSAALVTNRGRTTRPVARAPDPDGGAPWGVFAYRPQCRAYGQLIGGHVGTVDASSGAITFTGGSTSCAPTPAGQTVSVQPVTLTDRGALSQGQVERRTLSGRTLLVGRARAGVTSVTIRTSRDVRDVVPTGPHHDFLVVYDGGLSGASVTLTPHGPHPGRPVRQRLFA